MSGAKVSNHDLGVATKTSGHEAHAGPPDVCFDPAKKVPSPHPNIAPTSRATEHTTGKTQFQGGQVVRVGDAIGPQSDPAHPDLGGGVVSQTYRFEARAGKGSPEIRAESKPPTRTTDTTTQNHGNTSGKMVIPASPNSLADAADDALKTCSYEKSTIKCSHNAAVKLAQILVLRGDTITIDAKRINAKKSGDAVACHQPTHMKWRVLRTGGLDRLGNALPKKDEQKTGDKLVLDESWTGPGEAILGMKVGHTDGGMSNTMSSTALQRSAQQAETFAQSNAVARGASRPTGQDYTQAIQAVDGRNAQNARSDAKLNTARMAAHLAIDVARFAREWRADQNPVRIQITGAACSGGVSYEVVAYPPHSFEFKFPLDTFKSVGRTFGRAMSVIGKVGKLGGIEVENSIQCPGSDFDFTITFKWEEVEGASYDIQRSAGFSFGGTMFKWTFDIGVPIANVLALVPIPGSAVLAKALNWLIKLVGEAKFGFQFSMTISMRTGLDCTWSHTKGWTWSVKHISIPVEFNFYFYVSFEASLLGQAGKMEGRGGVKSKPVINLESDDAGLHIGNEKFDIQAYGTINVYVDTFLYTCNEALDFSPEALKMDLEKKRWKTLVKN